MMTTMMINLYAGSIAGNKNKDLKQRNYKNNSDDKLESQHSLDIKTKGDKSINKFLRDGG